MAEANLSVSVGIELHPDDRTAAWLESLGWVRPEAPSQESVGTELDADDEDWSPAEMLGGAADVEALIPPARTLQTEVKTCGHMEPGTPCDWDVCRQPDADKHKKLHEARRLRDEIMGELVNPGRVNELLRACGVDVKALNDTYAQDGVCDC